MLMASVLYQKTHCSELSNMEETYIAITHDVDSGGAATLTENVGRVVERDTATEGRDLATAVSGLVVTTRLLVTLVESGSRRT